MALIAFRLVVVLVVRRATFIPDNVKMDAPMVTRGEIVKVGMECFNIHYGLFVFVSSGMQ